MMDGWWKKKSMAAAARGSRAWWQHEKNPVKGAGGGRVGGRLIKAAALKQNSAGWRGKRVHTLMYTWVYVHNRDLFIDFYGGRNAPFSNASII